MNQLLAIPLEFRLLGCFVLGAIVASFLNLAIYRLAWNFRNWSPWSAPPEGASPRVWADRIPIVGWLRLRRDAHVLGSGYWIRPFLIELFSGFGLAALYWYETERLAMFGSGQEMAMAPSGPWWTVLTPHLAHGLFLAHALLLALMLVATFIDIDEKTIPDAITIPGTLIGLALITVNPWMMPPEVSRLCIVDATVIFDFMHLAAPRSWPTVMGGKPFIGPLWMALGCLWLWCFALLPRCWYQRYGVRRAARYFVAKIVRDPLSWVVLAIAVSGSIAVAVVWWRSGHHWAGLFSSLVGMSVGTGIIWSVRLVGHAVLKKEAMGFGDVTLMAMIGSFLGWQAVLIVFFLAPFAGLIIGVLQWLIIRDNAIPYGPFLCLATLYVLVRWSSLWNHIGPVFRTLGPLVPLILIICLVAMAVLLALLQLIKRLIHR